MMMKLAEFLFLLIFTGYGQYTEACSCASRPNDFFASIANNNSPGYFERYSIVKGSFIGMTANGYGARLRIVHNYYGASTADTVTIWGSYGGDCRASCQPLCHNPPDTFILAMRHLTGRLAAFEDLNDYEVSFCGYFLVQVKRDSVFGGGPGSFTEGGFDLHHFEDSLAGIIHTLGVDSKNGFEDDNLRLYPNPVGSSATLAWYQQEAALMSITIIDMAGNVVKTIVSRKAYTPGSHNLTQDLSALASGNYVLHVSGEGSSKSITFSLLRR